MKGLQLIESTYTPLVKLRTHSEWTEEVRKMAAEKFGKDNDDFGFWLPIGTFPRLHESIANVAERLEGFGEAIENPAVVIMGALAFARTRTADVRRGRGEPQPKPEPKITSYMERVGRPKLMTDEEMRDYFRS